MEKKPDKEDIDMLLKGIHHRNYEVFGNCIWYLGHLREKRAVEPLIDLILTDLSYEKTPEQEAAVEEGLHLYDRAKARDIRRQRDDERYKRRLACEALGRIGDERAVGPLASLYSGDFGGYASKALLEIGEPVIGPLKRLLVDDREDPLLRGFVIGVLKELCAEDIKEYILDIIASGTGPARKDAIYALGDLGGETPVDVLFGLLERGDREIRFTALGVLGHFPEKRVIKKLIPYLGIDHEDDLGCLKRAAMRSLEKIGAPTLPFLAEALGNEDVLVRREAAWILRCMEDDRALEPFIKVFRDPGEDRTVRKHAVEGLGCLNNEELIPLFNEALKDDDPMVREAALRYLSKYKDLDITKQALNALEDEHLSVVLSAAWYFSEHPCEEALIPLIRALVDRDAGHTRSFERAFGSIRGKMEEG